MPERRGDPLRRRVQGVVGKMGVPGGCLCVGVTEDPPHHRQTLASRHHLPDQPVPEVMEPHVFQSVRLADPSPVKTRHLTR